MTKIILVLALLLAGCMPNSETTLSKDVPEGLKDCKAFWYNNAFIMRCPNSATATLAGGKTKTRAVVIEGVEYVEKQ